MDDRRFDSLTRALAQGTNRRSILKGLLGFGSGALAGGVGLDAKAARRPTPAPKPISCPGRQIPSGSGCVCPTGLTDCGPDCCNDQGAVGPGYSECCDNACCPYPNQCVGEELCCPRLPDAGCLDARGACCSTLCEPAPGGAACCPADRFCPGGVQSDDLCCTGSTPQQCNCGTNANHCIPAGQTCCNADVDCAHLNLCDGLSWHEFVCGSQGYCIAKPPVSCDDATSCTTDSCNAASGCSHSPNTGAPCGDCLLCSDHGICNVPVCSGCAVCDGGACVPGDCAIDCYTCEIQPGGTQGICRDRCTGCTECRIESGIYACRPKFGNPCLSCQTCEVDPSGTGGTCVDACPDCGNCVPGQTAGEGRCVADDGQCTGEQICCPDGDGFACENGPYCGCDRDADCPPCSRCNQGTCEVICDPDNEKCCASLGTHGLCISTAPGAGCCTDSDCTTTGQDGCLVGTCSAEGMCVYTPDNSRCNNCQICSDQGVCSGSACLDCETCQTDPVSGVAACVDTVCTGCAACQEVDFAPNGACMPTLTCLSCQFCRVIGTVGDCLDNPFYCTGCSTCIATATPGQGECVADDDHCNAQGGEICCPSGDGFACVGGSQCMPCDDSTLCPSDSSHCRIGFCDNGLCSHQLAHPGTICGNCQKCNDAGECVWTCGENEICCEESFAMCCTEGQCNHNTGVCCDPGTAPCGDTCCVSGQEYCCQDRCVPLGSSCCDDDSDCGPCQTCDTGAHTCRSDCGAGQQCCTTSNGESQCIAEGACCNDDQCVGIGNPQQCQPGQCVRDAGAFAGACQSVFQCTDGGSQCCPGATGQDPGFCVTGDAVCCTDTSTCAGSPGTCQLGVCQGDNTCGLDATYCTDGLCCSDGTCVTGPNACCIDSDCEPNLDACTPAPACLDHSCVSSCLSEHQDFPQTCCEDEGYCAYLEMDPDNCGACGRTCDGNQCYDCRSSNCFFYCESPSGDTGCDGFGNCCTKIGRPCSALYFCCEGGSCVDDVCTLS